MLDSRLSSNLSQTRNRQKIQVWTYQCHGPGKFEYLDDWESTWPTWPEQNGAMFEIFSSLRSDVFHCPWRLLLLQHSWVPTGRIVPFALGLHCTGCTGYVTLSHVVSLCRTHGARSTRWNWDQCSNVRSSCKGLIYIQYIYIYNINKKKKNIYIICKYI